MTAEFDLIRRYFTRPTPSAALGVGDDAALLGVAAGMQLVVSCDMLVEGTHFLPDADPWSLGWKTVAVSVSDLAAMAARPRWATLAVSLPQADEAWIGPFAEGLLACCDAFGVELVGGDTTRGPLNLCATLFGEVPAGRAVTRAGARAGDDLWVSGQPGRAVLALGHLLNGDPLPSAARADCLAALHAPQPRLALGLALRGVASAMLDVSDGLLGDLGHILQRSGVGARIEAQALPVAVLLSAGIELRAAEHAVLGGGDDYELLFCAAPERRDEVLAAAETGGVEVHRIGSMLAEAGRLEVRGEDGRIVALPATGYQHFAPSAPDSC